MVIRFNYAYHFPNSKHASGERFVGAVEDLAAEFLKQKTHALRRSSLERVDIAIRCFLDIYGPKRNIATMSPHSLMQFKHELVIGRKGSTVNNHITTVNSFLKWLYKMEYINKDYSDILEKVKEAPSDISPFSFDEIQSAIDNCHVLQHKNLITVAVYTGLRTGELTTLAWEDVDLDVGVLHIRRSGYKDRGLKTTKADKDRFVDLLPPAIEALKLQKALTLNDSFPAKEHKIELPDKSYRTEKLRFVFNPKAVRAQKGSDHDYYGHRAVLRIWASMCAKAGIQYRKIYQLRHTYASWMITFANVNISYLARQMGHADITMIAKIYGKWLEEANKSESERVWRELQQAQTTYSSQNK
ncbi:tyrosine-type recombinase/integrase [Vibrio alfacsensis]|uniref:tyrosine-type recombinase/integrase n=1 Tax=Vibrio alfacsensis TaxID=1074311 RepID=UPI0040682708